MVTLTLADRTGLVQILPLLLAECQAFDGHGDGDIKRPLCPFFHLTKARSTLTKNDEDEYENTAVKNWVDFNGFGFKKVSIVFWGLKFVNNIVVVFVFA